MRQIICTAVMFNSYLTLIEGRTRQMLYGKAKEKTERQRKVEQHVVTEYTVTLGGAN